MTDLNQVFEKLLILPCRDSCYSDIIKENISYATINPATYSSQDIILYDDSETSGGSATKLKFNMLRPQKINFDLVFDGTGVINNGILDEVNNKVPVNIQIERFRRNIFYFNSEEHRPPYLKIIWGTLLFKGILNQIDFEYKVFSANGIPIRAFAKCQFTGSVEDTLRAAIENRLSPDITHEILFTAVDRLDRLSEKNYKDTNHYLSVANFNMLDSFRKIDSGTRLLFPPLSK